MIARLACVAMCAALVLGGGVATAAPASHHVSSNAPAAIARDVVGLVNHERAAHGRRRLTVNRHLVRTATRHSKMMNSRREFSHQVRGERDLAKRVSRTGYRWRYLGENIAYSARLDHQAAVHLVNLWYHEKPPNDGHRYNILAPFFRNVGIGVVRDRAQHRLWLTADFGRH